jgi:ribose transport system substrate-binding protein
VLALALAPLQRSASADDASKFVEEAKAAVARYAGPQTEWLGPTSAPKPDAGKLIVYLSGDEQNDISREYGIYIKEAAEKIGWKVTIIDGKGSPTSWLAGMNQAIALKPAGIALFADAASLQDPIKKGIAEGIKFVGLHAASLPGPAPDLNLFVNIQEDPREIGKAEADWAIADSNGTARVIVLSHNEYAIAKTKSEATRDEVLKCTGCQVLDYVNSPASEAAQRQPQLTTSWVQRFGLPFYATSVGDNDWDFAVPVLRTGGVKPDEVKLIAADGNRSAYERIRKGGQYQVVTVSEPIELQAYQAVDELNRAFHDQPPSGFVQPPYLVTIDNIKAEGGDKNIFVPSNDYNKHYLEIWGVKD